VSPIDSAAVRGFLLRCAQAVSRHQAELTRLDAALGDGDHGDNLAVGFQAVVDGLAAATEDETPGQLLRRAGYELVASVGGASGPLYGAAFIAAGLEAADAEELDGELVARMLEAAAAGLARRGRCEIGDKTIYDTLQPAAQTYRSTWQATDDPDAAVVAAVHAAARGMRSTRPMIARRGLALRLGPRSAGHIDPGAVSCFLLIASLAPDDRARERVQNAGVVRAATSSSKVARLA
jgi:dihydroxyacetone kinase-like protein